MSTETSMVMAAAAAAAAGRNFPPAASLLATCPAAANNTTTDAFVDVKATLSTFRLSVDLPSASENISVPHLVR